MSVIHGHGNGKQQSGILLMHQSFFQLYFRREMLGVLVLGIAGGLPLHLYHGTLAYWLAKEGISIQTIGLFSLATFPASLKFLWAPLMDRVPLPFLKNLMGQRRSWLLFSQLISTLALFFMATCSCEREGIFPLAIASCFLSFGAANQNVLILAYQVEAFNRQYYGPTESICVLGYRMGMLLAGAGAMHLSETFQWPSVYGIMAGLSLMGPIATLLVREPQEHVPLLDFKKEMRSLKSFAKDAVLGPFQNFMAQPLWLASLFIIFLYKLGDNLIGSMLNIYYDDFGHSAADIANASKFFGMLASVAGGAVGGYFISRLEIYRALFLFGLIHGLALFFYNLVHLYPGHLGILYFVSGIEHFTGGLSLVALFSYQMCLSHKKYATTQLALLTSCSHMGRTLFSSFSGFMVDLLSWEVFFSFAGCMSLAILPLILWVKKRKGL